MDNVKVQMIKSFMEQLNILRHQISDIELMDTLLEKNDPKFRNVTNSKLTELKGRFEEREKEVRDMILKLPDGPGKTALYLRYVCGLKMKAIIIDLDINERTLRRQINKDIELIYDTIIKEGNDNEREE